MELKCSSDFKIPVSATSPNAVARIIYKLSYAG